MKDFNALIENKPVFDQPVKNKQEAYGKLWLYSEKLIRLIVPSKILV